MPTGDPPATSLNGSKSDNALHVFSYTMLMSTGGNVTKITAGAFIGDVPVDAKGIVLVRQSFSVIVRTQANVV
jgi:hypothetical protein